MPKQTDNIQDLFLNKARKAGIPVTIHVMNGYQIKNAVIKSYDNFVLIVEAEKQQMMIYKHAVSSITPQKPLEINREREEKEEKGKEENEAK